MRVRTVVAILFVFAFVWFVVSTIRLNEGLVTLRFAFTRPLEIELWMALLAAFGAGAGVILFFDIAGGARRYARDRQRRREQRAREEVEELYVEGLDNMMNGRHRKALDRFDRVLEQHPEHRNALIKKGDTLRALRRYREAAEVLERTIRQNPADLVALYSLSDVYLGAGADERARSILERIIQTDPETTVSAHRKLRDLLVRKQQWEQAAEVQQELTNMVTNAEEQELEQSTAKGIQFGLGVEHLKKGRAKEAAERFRAILSDDEGFVPAHVRLGEALLEMEQTEEAVSAWRRGFEATGSTEPLSALQNFYLKDEQPEEAIGVWKQALVLSDNELPLRYGLGKLYYRLFMLDEALREFQLIEDRVSGLPALHLYIARILESQGNLSAALAKTKLLVAEVEAFMKDYVCNACDWRRSEWSERCSRCGRWNSIALHLPAAASPEPAIRPAPTWSTP